MRLPIFHQGVEVPPGGDFGYCNLISCLNVSHLIAYFYHIMANDSGLGWFSIYYGRIQSLSLLNWGLQSSSQQNGYDKSRRRKLPSEALFSQATSQNFVWFQVHWDVVQINSLTYLLFEAWTTSSVLLIIPHCAIPKRQRNQQRWILTYYQI